MNYKTGKVHNIH